MKNKLFSNKIKNSSLSFKVLCVAFAIALVSLMIPHNAFAYTVKNARGGVKQEHLIKQHLVYL